MDAVKAVDALQQAVWSPAAWPDALEGLASAFDCTMVTLVNATRGEVSCSRQATEIIDGYLHRRTIPDTRHARVDPRLDEGFRTDYDDFTPAEIARDAYYQEFLRPVGVGWHAAARLPGVDGDNVVISFKRSPQRGLFDHADVARLNALLPHFRAAARQAAVIARSRFDGELAAFDRLHRGAMLLDASGRLLACNRSLAFGDGLIDVACRPAAVHPDSDRELQRAIVAARGRDAASAPSPLVVHRPSGKRPFLLDVFAIAPGSVSALTRARVLIVVHDLDASPPARPDVLQRAFGLTPKEAALAQALAAGVRLKRAAADLGISEEHARQRVKALLEKTDTASQADLRALLARMF
jgi:DNA-binding CsgD family transcriptional regulator